MATVNFLALSLSDMMNNDSFPLCFKATRGARVDAGCVVLWSSHLPVRAFMSYQSCQAFTLKFTHGTFWRMIMEYILMVL